jgi:hypothetical protein
MITARLGETTMIRSTARSVLAALVVGGMLLVSPHPTALARGQDVCPEPNNEFQKACFLGRDSEALGFISASSDTDAYRIEVLDFNVDVHIELAQSPFPYRIELADWNGDIIDSSREGVIDTTVDVPGSYYIFVDSPGGQFSDANPYTILRALTYPGSSIPELLYSGEFRATGEGFTGSNEFAKYTDSDGKYTVAMNVGGTIDDPTLAWAGWGPGLTDFTLTADTRTVNDVDSGYLILFRRIDNLNFYAVGIDTRDGATMLMKVIGGEPKRITDWTPSDAIDTSGGVNRTVVWCAEDEIFVNVNGEMVIYEVDGTFKSGNFGFGAIAFGAPPIISFDNLIVTTPAEG